MLPPQGGAGGIPLFSLNYTVIAMGGIAAEAAVAMAVRALDGCSTRGRATGPIERP
ncbi:MAG: hypothetical protein ABI920_09630 [Casimicrobiaceae bacterium]